jgi:hypothetical protein
LPQHQCGKASPYRDATLIISPRLSLGEDQRVGRLRKGLAFPHSRVAAANDMQYAWYDLAGNFGVALMVLGYLLLQAEKVRSSDLSYSLMNGVGALLVLISLLYRFNLSAFLVEAFWLLISIYGLIMFAARPRAKEGR